MPITIGTMEGIIGTMTSIGVIRNTGINMIATTGMTGDRCPAVREKAWMDDCAGLRAGSKARDTQGWRVRPDEPISRVDRPLPDYSHNPERYRLTFIRLQR
jgi:hypothetical protein